MFAGPALAAEPPAPGHQVISFPQRDFVSATGYAKGVPAVVTIKRRNPATGKLDVIAKSEPTLPQDDPDTAEFDGLVEVNHPGGGCWTKITPNIHAGDKVQVTQAASATTPASDDTTTTAFVTAGRPELLAGTTDTVVIKGTAQSMATSSGTPLAKQIPNAQIEERLIGSSADRFEKNNRRDLRATVATGSDGTLRYDVPGSTTNFNWTATYKLSAADVQRALNAESRILWLGRVPADGNELTIYEDGPDVIPGPSAPCTAPLEGTENTPPVAPKPPADSTVPAATKVLGAPAAPHNLLAFPSRDFISAEGYRPGVSATVNVFRPDAAGVRKLVGSATGTVGADGLFEVNHPGGSCWIDQTPNIRAGDVVRISQDDGTGAIVAEETTVANVVAKPARRVTFASNGTVNITVDGTAATGGTEAAPAGSRIPLAQLEQRLISGANDPFAKNGRRDLRAPGDGVLRYVGTDGFTWRATYAGLSEADLQRAVASETRILWLGTDPLAGTQGTIFEIGDGVLNGPAAPCTAPAEAA